MTTKEQIEKRLDEINKSITQLNLAINNANNQIAGLKEEAIKLVGKHELLVEQEQEVKKEKPKEEIKK